MGRFEAGAAKVNITPPVGIELAGYGLRVDGTNRSNRINDPIWIRALAMGNKDNCVLILVLDLLGVELPITQRIRSLVTDRIPVAPDNILIVCTHNHMAPSVLDHHEKKILVDQGYREATIAAAVDVAEQAFGVMAPAQVGVGRTEVYGVGANRKVWLDDGSLFHHIGVSARVPPVGRTVAKKGIIDPEMSVLCIRDGAGKIIALLMNYACHPWLYNGNQVSSEVHGGCVEVIEKELRAQNPDMVALFVPGAGSNITTLQLQTPMPPGLPEREGWFSAERTRLGGIMAQGAVRAMEGIEEYSSPESVSSEICKITCAVYDRKLSAVLAEHGHLPPTELTMDTEVQVIKVGHVAIVGLPTEVYVEIGLEIKKRSRFVDTFVISQSNDYFADIVTHEAVQDGCCPELDWTCVHPDIRQHIMACLESRGIIEAK